MIGHGFGPGGRFFLGDRRRLRTVERSTAEASHARVKTTQDGTSISGSGGENLSSGGLIYKRGKGGSTPKLPWKSKSNSTNTTYLGLIPNEKDTGIAVEKDNQAPSFCGPRRWYERMREMGINLINRSYC